MPRRHRAGCEKVGSGRFVYRGGWVQTEGDGRKTERQWTKNMKNDAGEAEEV